MKRLLCFISTFFATGANAVPSVTLLPLPNGSAMIYEYEEEELRSIERMEPDGNTYRVELQDTWWDEVKYYTIKGINFLRNEGCYSVYMQGEIDQAAHTLLGSTCLQMMGYWNHAPCTGTYGAGEVNEKVRITFINGILNTRSDIGRTMEQLSNAHGGVNVHYVFHPTEGWARDLMNGLFSKLGYVSHPVRQLAEMWRELIHEMGGTESGGMIIHYAHSVGAIDSQNAMSLLTPEELRMIHVIALGSPSNVPEGGFGSVENYASVRDGVALLDPVGFFEGMVFPDSNIHLIGTWWGLPIVEHPLDRQAYKELLDELGARFQEKYAQP